MLDGEIGFAFRNIEKSISAVSLIEDSFVMSEFLLSQMEEYSDDVVRIKDSEHLAVKYLVGIFE